MMNYIWLGIILISVVVGGFTGRLPDMTIGVFAAAKDAVVSIALPLAGGMAVWLGMMRLAEQSGFVQLLARFLRPLMSRLFPDVPPEHPAMGSMVLSVAANMLGLGNAATPLGLRAMSDLERLNPRPGVATNAMCTFLAICTSSVQLLPTTAILIFVGAGSKNPTAIVSTAFLATACAAIAGVTSAKLLERLKVFRLAAPDPSTVGNTAQNTLGQIDLEKIAPAPLTKAGRAAIACFLVLFGIFFAIAVFPEKTNSLLESARSALPSTTTKLAVPSPIAQGAGRGIIIRSLDTVSVLAVPFLLSFFPLYAALRGVKVYEQFVEGAREAFPVVLKIVPFLVAMLAAIAMLREAGVIKLVSDALAPALNLARFPADLMPLVLMRPLSGGATFGIFAELVKRFGPDSFTSRLAGTIYGSTETTFYVLTVYFGSVAIKRTRHAVLAGLIADLSGVVASTFVCHAVFAQ